MIGARHSTPYRFILLSVLVATGAIVFSHHFGYYQFGGYDLSPVIDLVYRLHNGEVPGRDFVNTLPLSFVAYLDLLQHVFGVNWSALLWGGSIAFAAASTVVIVFGRPLSDDRVCAAVIAILAVPLLVTNHVWHSVLTGYVAVIFLIFVLGSLTLPKPPPGYWIGVALCAGGFFFSKQNVGLPLTLMLLAFCSFRALKYRDVRSVGMIAAVLGSIAVTAIIYVAVLGIDLDQFAYTFTATSGRAVPSLEQISQTLIGRHVIAVELALLYLLWAFWKLPPAACPIETVIICVGFLAVGALAFLTNWDIKYNDAALVLVPLAFLIGAVPPGNKDRTPGVARGRCALVVSAAFMIVMAFDAGAARKRMEGVGPGMFFERAPLARIENGVFSGLWTGPRMVAARTELGTFVARHPDASGSLFCGPRIEFCYADLALASPRGLALWWHPGSSYAMRDAHLIATKFVESRFRYLAFLRDDRTRMPQAVLDYIDHCYGRIGHDGVLEFYAQTCR